MSVIAEKVLGYRAYLISRNESASYANMIKIWLEYLDTKETFTLAEITEFFTKNTYMPRSKNLFISACRNYYNVYLGLPKEQNPWTAYKAIKPDSYIADVLTETDLYKVIALFQTNAGHLMNYVKSEAVLTFWFFTGVRLAEFVSLRRKNIFIDTCEAKIFGKGGKERIVKFSKTVGAHLRLYMESEEEVTNAFNLSRCQVKYIQKKLTKLTGRKIHSHLWRTSFCHNLVYQRSVPVAVVSKLLGHSSVRVTNDNYLQPSAKEISESYEKLVG